MVVVDYYSRSISKIIPWAFIYSVSVGREGVSELVRIDQDHCACDTSTSVTLDLNIYDHGVAQVLATPLDARARPGFALMGILREHGGHSVCRSRWFTGVHHNNVQR